MHPLFCYIYGRQDGGRLPRNLAVGIIRMPVQINAMARNRQEGAPDIQIGDDLGIVTHPASALYVQALRR